MKKKKTATQLRKELDGLFSKWVRLSYANSRGYVTCYTCRKSFFWKKIQNGHFVSRQYLATRFDPRNCRPQCWGCNGFGNGRLAEYAAYLEKETPGITVILYKEARKIIKNYPYASEIERYVKLLRKFSKFLEGSYQISHEFY